uniref:Uncharacterized protein n=1 Tax=Prolemur simus TaxID=1328070 RepID=A0A8C8ZZB7_PROSS
MKGTLLVLALLVTGELGFKTGIFSLLALGNKQLLDISLDLVNATKPEKAGFEKIQACYNERGPPLSLFVLLSRSSITLSKECISSALNMVKNDVKQRLSKMNPLGR